MTKKYYFISYTWRNHSGEVWEIENEAIEIEPVEWILQAYSFPETHRLLWSYEITEQEYLKLDGMLS